MQRITRNVYTKTDICGCNPSIVFTGEGAVFVDTAQMVSALMEMRSFALERGPIRYLINTEAHPDHVFGNFWIEEEAITIGQENMPLEQMNMPGVDDIYAYSVAVMQENDPKGLDLLPPKEAYKLKKRPDITFKEHLSLQVGDTTLELYHTPGHSAGQTTVIIPQEGVAMVGDTLCVDCQVGLYTADIDKLLSTLSFLENLDVEYIIPGHGSVVGKDYIGKQKAFIYEWIGAVSNGIYKGWSLDECIANIRFEDRYPMDIGRQVEMEYFQTNNVIAAYNYLRGENNPLRGGNRRGEGKWPTGIMRNASPWMQ